MMPLVSSILGVISLLIGLAYGLMVLYFFYGFKTGKVLPKPLLQSHATTVSIIVAARNEETNIVACIQSLLAQNYPSQLTEIIIVDDDSTDTTLHQLTTILKHDNRIKLIRLDPESGKGKKAAIAKAIEQAGGELIVTTDADCTVSPAWLTALVNCYVQRDVSMVLGTVVFYDEVTLFEKIQSLEFMALIGITAGAANLNLPFLCNGANLAYDKSVFTSIKGFESNFISASGDDILLLQKIKRRKTKDIAFVMDVDAVVKTKAQPTFTKFISQRKRWFTKSLVIPDALTSIIAFIVFSICTLIILNPVMGFISGNDCLFHYALGLFILKSTVDFILLYSVTRYFRKNKLLTYFFIAQLFIIIYSCFIIFTLRNKTYNWKGRKVN